MHVAVKWFCLTELNKEIEIIKYAQILIKNKIYFKSTAKV